ncbi:hypothetical protein GEV33_008801 [Tenebrio molitor]|uniref:Endonuclease-reverse transcriptase n=1 Tax=Tenebrio molitor TaxID=7067 RepID=A0A8J6HG24_TENMO|nr:hypothetical protein GEV33_008801 [Tenebrio molitor]
MESEEILGVNKPDHDSSPETEQKLFRGGTQVDRTQLKREKTEDQNMEEIKQILLELSREVKEMRNDISQNNKEMKSLREDVRTMQVNWEKEKLDLEEKITKTEQKIEKLEKDKIRNNLMVTGMRMDTEDEELLRNSMEKMINKELSLNVKVNKVYKIGQDKYNVEMNKWNEKLMVLKTKGKLRGKEIYIDSALTLTEREIQKNIRDFAKKERTNGATVRVKYQGVEIDGRSWKWNKKEQKLMKEVEVNNRDSRKLYELIKHRNSTSKKTQRIDNKRWETYYTELFREEKEITGREKENVEMEDSNNEDDAPSYDEYMEIIAQLKTKKAAGPDQISNELIKQGGHELLSRVYRILVAKEESGKETHCPQRSSTSHSTVQ